MSTLIPPAGPTIHFLLWSNKHGMWWRPDGRGYTDDITQAGAYTQDEAVTEVVQSAMCADRAQVTLMVAAPPDWTPPPAEVTLFGPGPLVDVIGDYLETHRVDHVRTVTVPGGEL